MMRIFNFWFCGPLWRRGMGARNGQPLSRNHVFDILRPEPSPQVTLVYNYNKLQYNNQKYQIFETSLEKIYNMSTSVFLIDFKTTKLNSMSIEIIYINNSTCS